jgi:hypothetical protein
MKNQFIPYEQALALKELGFDEPCFAYYFTTNGENWEFAIKSEFDRIDDAMIIGPNFKIIAPLYQQAFRWFREKHELYSYIEPVNVVGAASPIKHDYVILENNEEEVFYTNMPYHSHEEAELACLKKLIEIVKQ